MKDLFLSVVVPIPVLLAMYFVNGTITKEDTGWIIMISGVIIVFVSLGVNLVTNQPRNR